MVDKIKKNYSIKEIELRYRRLFEAAQDGILILNADTGKIIDVNPFLEKLLGYSKIEFLGKNLWELQASQNIEENKSKFKKLQKEHYIRYEDLPLETKDGRFVNVEFVSNIYKVGSEKVIQCNIRDITERKKIEARLTLETAKQEAILSSVGDGIIATGVDGKILVMNIAAQKILGWNIQEVIGGVLSDIIIIENEQGEIIPLNIENVVISNAFYINRNKIKIPVAINIKPIFWIGKMSGAVIVFRDRSKEIEIEKVKEGILLQTIHDLRAPSNAIRLAAEIYSDPKQIIKNPNSLKEGVKLIQEANFRMLDLINSLLKNAKNQANLEEKIQVDIAIVLQKVIGEFNLAILKKKIKIDYNLLKKIQKY